MGALDGVSRSGGLGPATLALSLALLAAACGDLSAPDGRGTAVPAESDRPPAAPVLDIRAGAGLEGLAASVGDDPELWSSMPGIPDSVLAGRRVTVWFVEDLAALDSVGLGQREPWVAGVADPARRLIGLRVDGAQRNVNRLRAVYRHEAAHVALHAATGGNASSWLQEGYAQIVSGTWDWREGWRLQFTLMRGGEGMLSDIDGRFRSGRDPETAYILAYTAVDALRALAGDAGLEALFGALRSGRSFDAAVRNVYGLTAEQFETRWRERVLDRYGWVYLLSRTAVVWLGVTLLVVGLGIARVRRDRRRLAEMKERERRETAAREATLRALLRLDGRPTDPPPGGPGNVDEPSNVS
ncbi:MAG: peptidase MA family metallohydrolase [Gemmatimonadota bacterium]